MTLSRLKKVDRPLVIILSILVIGGFVIFNSASLGLLAKDGDQFSKVAFSQTFFGLFFGTIACVVLSRMDYKIWKKYAWPFLIASFILTLLVFVPGLGFEHGGAVRWISIGNFTFQPSEILKLATVVFLAAWYSAKKSSIDTFKKGTLPLLLVIGAVGAVLLAQPDTDNFGVLVCAALSIYVVAGGRLRNMLLMALVGGILFAALAYNRPYIRERLLNFVDPTARELGSGFQAKQSLIAIGSGGFSGRGFGQSLQKFTYLPEPIGDSIFAVAAEEFGFIGASAIVIMFLLFALRCLTLAAKTTDDFGRLLVVGIAILVISQAFLNMGAMLGILPLTGITLPFVSHGGSSLLVVMAEIGIVLSVSRKIQS